MMNAVAVAVDLSFPFYIEPKPESLNRAVSAAHLAGSTHKKLLKKKLSSTKGNAQGKSKLVSYVPQYMLQEAGVSTSAAHPESDPHVTVNAHTKRGSYKSFVWEIR